MKNPWDDEPTPLVDDEEEHVANRHNEWACRGRNPVSEYACRSEFVRDLERRLRHARRKLAELDPTLDLGPGLE